MLVNNVGLAAPGPTRELDLGRWKHALKLMIQRENGRIFNTVSILESLPRLLPLC